MQSTPARSVPSVFGRDWKPSRARPARTPTRNSSTCKGQVSCGSANPRTSLNSRHSSLVRKVRCSTAPFSTSTPARRNRCRALPLRFHLSSMPYIAATVFVHLQPATWEREASDKGARGRWLLQLVIEFRGRGAAKLKRDFAKEYNLAARKHGGIA